MKIIVFAINTLIQIIAAAIGLLMLIIAMNGYSEDQAAPGIIFYIAVAILSALGLGAASVYTAQKLKAKTSLGGFAASAISVLIYALLGGIILIIAVFGAILTAEALRK